MKIHKTFMEGLLFIEADKYMDERGYFTRLFRDSELPVFSHLDHQNGNYEIKEINRSLSYKKGIIRGMHMQKEPMAQDKLVQCLEGEIFDVVIDMRPESSTYLKWFGVKLKDTDMLLVPKGFAHGFQTLTDNCVVQYFVSQYYSPDDEVGVRFDDPKIGIEWPVKEISTSEKDKSWDLL